MFDRKSSLDVKRGRYNKGGTTDKFPTRLGWWDRKLSFMQRQLDDITYQITEADAYRIDLIAYSVYKKADLGWVILQYNNIVDIMEELAPGKIILLPSSQRVLTDITI